MSSSNDFTILSVSARHSISASRKARDTKVTAHSGLPVGAPIKCRLRAERSSNGFAGQCGGHLARETSTLVSHQMAPQSTAGCSLLAGVHHSCGTVYCLWPLFGTSRPWKGTPRLNDCRRASSACLSSANRWLTGATVAPPSLPREGGCVPQGRTRICTLR